MKKTCANCGAAFETAYPSKVYCSYKCAEAAYFKRDESAYEFLPDSPEPLYSFECKNCGKLVNVYSKYDQRSVYCCGQCAAEWKLAAARIRYTKRKPTNLGMSGGMSLGSLIKREARSVDKAEKPIYVKTCPNCGEKFETPKDTKKYCSVHCQILAEKKRWKQRKAGANV